MGIANVAIIERFTKAFGISSLLIAGEDVSITKIYARQVYLHCTVHHVLYMM